MPRFQATTTACTDKAFTKGTVTADASYTRFGAGWVREGNGRGTTRFFFSIRRAKAKKEQAELPERTLQGY